MNEAVALVALENVDVTLDGRRVLRGITWRLEAGEHWAILGANGAGKSTLLRVIAGEQWPDPNGGTRAYHLESDETDSVWSAKAGIAHVSPEAQERHVRLRFALRGREFVESGFFGGDYAYDRLNSAQARRVDALVAELKLGGLTKKSTEALSQGELRRLLIARALVREPRILLLDEWSSGLDEAARAEVLALLERIRERTQLVIASHRADDFPAYVTRRAELRHGRLIADAPNTPSERRAHERAATPPARPVGSGEVIIRIRDADVFVETQHVLYGIAWEIRRGEQWAIEGPNGSGKTTLAKLVAGTLTPVRGAYVERFGSAEHISVWELKRRIVLLSDELQTQYDRSLTIEDVVVSGLFSSIGLMRVPTGEQRKRATQLIDDLQLQSLRGRDFLALSFGERRKVLIARALVGTPEIVIVDENFSGLDEAFRKHLFAVLGALAQNGVTCIMIAHHTDDIPPFITNHLRLNNGRIVGA